MFDWVQVQARAEPLKDIHRVVTKPLLRCLGCVFRVVVLLEGEPSPKVLCTLLQVFIKDISVLCFIHLSFDPDLSPRSCCWNRSPILSRRSTDTAWFLLWQALSIMRYFIDRCVLFQIISNHEFTTGGLQSSCRNILRMINGNRMHLSSILNGIATGILMSMKSNISKTYIHFVSMGYCV